MIRLHLLPDAGPPIPDGRHSRWLFLGKNTALEAACGAAMPPDLRLDVAQGLREIAERLRSEFTREVARIGAEQKDLPGWHSSTFAWKTPGASDLFQLSCYRLLIRALALGRSEHILVFLEDSWLYEDCRRDDELRRFIVAPASAGPWIQKIRLALRGAAGRAVWAWRAAASLARQRLYSRRQTRGASPEPKYAVCSLPSARCFGPGSDWNDFYMPGLADMIARIGGSVLRFVPSESRGFERELARRSSSVRPLILEAAMSDIAAALTAVWRERNISSFSLEGVPMPLLAEREWWTDAGGARWCEYALFDSCFRRFLDREKPVAVVYPYENQPWEKLICAASSGAGAATIGYQHSLVPRFFLGYWAGPEGPASPLPDHILASGPLQREILIETGTKPAKIVVGGSMRFRYLASSSGKTEPRRPGASRILVAATLNRGMTMGILDAVRSAFPDGGTRDGLELFFRPHPAARFDLPRDIAGMTTVGGELSSRLPEFDLVVSAGGTTALEARFLGVPVILFHPAAALDAQDPGNLVPEGFFEYATALEMREKVLRRLRESPKVFFDSAGLRDAIFSPVDERAWRGCLAARVGSDERRS